MMISCSKKLTTLIRLSVCQGKLFHDFIMKYGYSQTNWSNRIIFKISKMLYIPLFGFYPIPSCLFQTFMDNASTSLWFLKLTDTGSRDTRREAKFDEKKAQKTMQSRWLNFPRNFAKSEPVIEITFPNIYPESSYKTSKKKIKPSKRHNYYSVMARSVTGGHSPH